MTRSLQRVPNFQLMLTDEQFRAIGHMVVQWAHLESEIKREIAWLLTRSEHKRKHMSLLAKFSTVTTNWAKLAKRSYRKHPDRIKAVNRIVPMANKIKRERDDISHGNFGSSGIFFKIRAGQVVNVSDTAASPERIEDLACRISDISAELFRHQRAVKGHYRGML